MEEPVKVESVNLFIDGVEYRQHPRFRYIFVSRSGALYSAISGRFLRPTAQSVTAKGYKYDYLYIRPSCINGRRPILYVHVAVLEAWVGPRPERHDCDHIDGDKTNNRLSNLRWLPISENRAQGVYERKKK